MMNIPPWTPPYTYVPNYVSDNTSALYASGNGSALHVSDNESALCASGNGSALEEQSISSCKDFQSYDELRAIANRLVEGNIIDYSIVTEYAAFYHKLLSELATKPLGAESTEINPDCLLTQISLSAVLLLEKNPDRLQELNIMGCNDPFLAIFVCAEFLRAPESNFYRFLGDSFATALDNMIDLIDTFKDLAGCFQALTFLPEGGFQEPFKQYIQNVCQKNLLGSHQLLFPFLLMNQASILHIIFAYLNHNQLHLANTVPFGEQGYKRISSLEYEQNCCISIQAKSIDSLAQNLFSSLDCNKSQDTDYGWSHEDKMDFSVERIWRVLSKDGALIPHEITPLSSMQLVVGPSCVISSIKALFKTLLMQESDKLSSEQQNVLNWVFSAWILSFKIFVLRHYAPAVGMLGEDNFGVICENIKLEINLLDSDKNSNRLVTAALADSFDVAVNCYAVPEPNTVASLSLS